MQKKKKYWTLHQWLISYAKEEQSATALLCTWTYIYITLHCISQIFDFTVSMPFISMSFCIFSSCWSSSSCSTSHCGSWTCWSGSSQVWFYTSYTLCCALNAGTTLCLWALFSSATTMSFLNCSETALCWAKPMPTLCPPTVWGSSHSEVSTVRLYRLWWWRGECWGFSGG